MNKKLVLTVFTFTFAALFLFSQEQYEEEYMEFVLRDEGVVSKDLHLRTVQNDDGYGPYTPDIAADYDIATCWAEGVKGPDKGGQDSDVLYLFSCSEYRCRENFPSVDTSLSLLIKF